MPWRRSTSSTTAAARVSSGPRTESPIRPQSGDTQARACVRRPGSSVLDVALLWVMIRSTAAANRLTVGMDWDKEETSTRPWNRAVTWPTPRPAQNVRASTTPKPRFRTSKPSSTDRRPPV